MNPKTLSLFIFIDALGWDILQQVEFFEHELPERRRLESVLGYSSACVPSILSGQKPDGHGHFSFFYYDPKHSPFLPLLPLSLVPDFFAGRGRVRNRLSVLFKKFKGYSGYFQLYNMPFRYLRFFDYSEKNDIFKADGMNRGDNIFTALDLSGIPYHVSDWRKSEDENIASLKADIEREEIEWAFSYNAVLDGVLHQYGPKSPESLKQIDSYKERLLPLIDCARSHYKKCDIYLFSDHGQALIEHHHDLIPKVQKLGLRFGVDYAAVYDSTMARFWFMNQDARSRITSMLSKEEYGSIIGEEEKKELGVSFNADKYGELFFLVDEGHLIVPSFMGNKPMAAMHGYHPACDSAYAIMLSNREIPEEIVSIADIYKLMSAPLGSRIR